MHTTTPGGTFVYFVEQLGYGIFPWVAAIPGAAAVAARARPAASGRDRATILVVSWALVVLALFGLSSTKFHHYAFPAVPALALLVALFLDRLLEEGVAAHAVALLAGAALFVLVGRDVWQAPKHLVDLFVYNYARPYPAAELLRAVPSIRLGALSLSLAPHQLHAGLFTFMGAAAVGAAAWGSRRWLVGTFAAGAVLFAVHGSWVLWRHLAPHWSQRDLVHTYFVERRGLEPLGAYYLNWRGETFYSQNTVRQFKSFERFRRFVEQPGREFVVVERDRLASLRGVLGEDRVARIVFSASNKYLLVVVEDGASQPAAAAEESPLTSPLD